MKNKKKLGLYYLACCLALVVLGGYFSAFFEEEFSFFIRTVLVLVLGVAIPCYIIMQVRCSNCKYQFLWKWFNNSRDLKKPFNPFLPKPACPNCGEPL